VRHLALGAAAASGLVAWSALAAAAGKGGGGYVDLMRGMGFHPAPGFALRPFSEGVALLNLGSAPVALAAALALAVPAAWGVALGWRASRRETAALLAFLAAATGAVVFFGVDKARYAHATSWIPLLFLALGLARGARDSARWSARLPGRASVAVGVAAALAAAAGGLAVMAQKAHATPFAVDAATAVLLAVLAAVALASAAGGRPRRAALGLTACAAAVAVALVTGGLARKETALFHVRSANAGSYALARWLARHAAPGEGAVVLEVGPVLHASGLPAARVVSFAATRAESVDGLVDAMRARGLTYAAYTWRPPVTSRSAGHYYRRKRVWLAEVFASGGAVPGFEHVATLPVDPAFGQADVQIYRTAPRAHEPGAPPAS
jgi:hypothetical protein